MSINTTTYQAAVLFEPELSSVKCDITEIDCASMALDAVRLF